MFVLNFVRIVTPISSTIRKDNPVKVPLLIDGDRRAMAISQIELTTEPNLTLHLMALYIIETDACDEQVGGIFVQQQPDQAKITNSYLPRSHINAENDCDTNLR